MERRSRHDGKRRRKKATKEQVLEMLRAWVLARKAKLEATEWSSWGRDGDCYVKVEEIIIAGRGSPNYIGEGVNNEGHLRWALHKLNLEGLVSRPHCASHGKLYHILYDHRTKAVPCREPCADDFDPPEGLMAVWDERPKEKLPRYSKRLQRRIRAATALLVALGGIL